MIAALHVQADYLLTRNVKDYQPAPLAYLLVIFGIVGLLYFISAEITKRWFFRHFGD
ncbi:MAG: hypothetical protein AB1894_04500 [Chloroflexota bacterium]